MQNKVLIIAEIGVNHNGNVEMAKQMVDLAAEAGADIVKFQTGIPELVMSRHAQKAAYQIDTTGNAEEGQLGMVKKLEFSMDTFAELKVYTEKKGVRFMSTPFELKSVAFLDGIGVDTWKIPSGEITNLPYLIAIGQTGKPVIMSTGMSTIDEIQAAVQILQTNGSGRISLLHCNTQYPTPYEDVNLRAMQTLREDTGLEVGYSDHTIGIEVPIAAVAMGATIIEKHFTLDRTLPGPDHKASIEPEDFRRMVSGIRHIEAAMGSGEKRVSPSEQPNMVIARKSIVTLCAVKKGDLFTEKNITTKRPGSGISPMRWFEILGTAAKRDFDEDELIEL